jgi:hypothetical protein
MIFGQRIFTRRKLSSLIVVESTDHSKTSKKRRITIVPHWSLSSGCNKCSGVTYAQSSIIIARSVSTAVLECDAEHRPNLSTSWPRHQPRALAQRCGVQVGNGPTRCTMHTHTSLLRTKQMRVARKNLRAGHVCLIIALDCRPSTFMRLRISIQQIMIFRFLAE